MSDENKYWECGELENEISEFNIERLNESLEEFKKELNKIPTKEKIGRIVDKNVGLAYKEIASNLCLIPHDPPYIHNILDNDGEIQMRINFNEIIDYLTDPDVPKDVRDLWADYLDGCIKRLRGI